MRDIELAPEERSLIEAARDGHAPSESQRARVRKGLNAKLAAGVAAPLLATTSAMAMVGKVGVGVALLAAVGTTAYVATSGPDYKAAPARVRPTSVPAPVARPAPQPEPLPAVVPGESPSEARPSAARPRTPVLRRVPLPTAPTDLAGELALLTQISDATKHGEVARAERLLADYDQRYRSAQLAQERAAAGILLECAAGRTASAQAQARRFLERWPRSPLVARINSSCANEAKTP
jgi:hypothetical protein